MQRGFPQNLKPAQARVWNFIARGDIFFSAREWPQWLQDLAVSEHKNNRDRYTFFYFLVANGMDPATAGEWTLMNDVVRGAPLSTGYNDHAHRQVIQMKKQLHEGTLFTGTKKMIDLATGKVLTK